MKDLQRFRVKDWFKSRGDETFRIDYPLNCDSIVFDVGGYEGAWAEKIFQKYNCSIYIFEPIEEFFLNIKNKFEMNKKVQVFNFGLGSSNLEISFNLDNDGTSMVKTENSLSTTTGRILKFDDFLSDQKINKIDLIKINIEGGEYDLVPALTSSKIINSINNIQIQFHPFVPDADKVADSIRRVLSETHHPTYYFDFVWENWALSSEVTKADLLKTTFSAFETIKRIQRDGVITDLNIEQSGVKIDDLNHSLEGIREELTETRGRLERLMTRPLVRLENFFRKIIKRLIFKN